MKKRAFENLSRPADFTHTDRSADQRKAIKKRNLRSRQRQMFEIFPKQIFGKMQHLTNFQKWNENDPKKTAENGISQQPINENGIRFLRVKRFWNPPTCEERKTVFDPV